MISPMARFIMEYGGHVETERGVYVYDEAAGEIRYIEKRFLGTPEEGSAWRIIEREYRGEVPRHRRDIPYGSRSRPRAARSVSYTDEPGSEPEQLLAMLRMAGGEFETQLYRYRLDMETRTVLRIEKALYYSGRTGPENWYVMGFFTDEP